MKYFHGFKKGDEVLGTIHAFGLNGEDLVRRKIVRKVTREVTDAIPVGKDQFKPRKVETYVLR